MLPNLEQKREALWATCHKLGATLQLFPKGAMGLTPDSVRLSPEYRQAKDAYDRAFRLLRSFNKQFPPPRRSRKEG